MNNLIKYGFFVTFLVSIFMNIVEPSLEHKVLQAVMAIGLLLFLYVDWHIKRITKKIIQIITQDLRLEHDKKTEAHIADEDFEQLYKKIDEKIFKSYLKFGWILLLILIAISVFNIFVYLNS